MNTHTVPSDVFDLLARGDGDTGGVLRAGQRSKRLLLLHELMVEAREWVPRSCAEADTDEAYAVLVAAQRRRPDVVDDLLLQPHVGAWVTHCLRSLVTDGSLAPEDLGHLGAIAASAAVRAGQPFSVTARLRPDGTLMLPTFGLARLARADVWCRLRGRSDDPEIEISTPGTTHTLRLTSARDTPTWLPLRRLQSTAHSLTIDILLDDLDPYRASDDLPVAERLSSADIDCWQHALDGAWSSLTETDVVRAAAIDEGISAIVALVSPGMDDDRSGSRHDAVGAVAMSLPSHTRRFAQALVHEYQHNKLSTLHDLVPLVARSSGETHYAPWKDDPRPVWGLLHGTYAYLGLAAFAEQECRRGANGRSVPGGGLAQFELALWRDQVGRALRSLRRCRDLTTAGRQFVETMRARLSDLRRTDVPQRQRLLARVACLDHETSWRLRNLVPDPEVVERVADAWIAGGQPPTDGLGQPNEVAGSEPLPSAARLRLFRRQFASPREAGGAGYGAADPADDRLVEEGPASAADAYRRQLIERPTDGPAWAGFVLAHRYQRAGSGSALVTKPETVRAIHHCVHERSGCAPDPNELVNWLAV